MNNVSPDSQPQLLKNASRWDGAINPENMLSPISQSDVIDVANWWHETTAERVPFEGVMFTLAACIPLIFVGKAFFDWRASSDTSTAYAFLVWTTVAVTLVAAVVLVLLWVDRLRPMFHRAEIKQAIVNHQWDNRWLSRVFKTFQVDPMGLALLTESELRGLSQQLEKAPEPVREAWSTLIHAKQGVRRCHEQGLMAKSETLKKAQADQERQRQTDPELQRQLTSLDRL